LAQKITMIYGYARISTDGQSVAAQVAALRKHGAGKVFREVASGAKADRPQLHRALSAGDVLMVTRLDRLARSTRDLLNTLAAIADRKAGFPISRRHMGRYHHGARPFDADRLRRPRRVRA
jgi:DNA invertase Pin-like site-specific DNA recombinase